jgi:hemerythrin
MRTKKELYEFLEQHVKNSDSVVVEMFKKRYENEFGTIPSRRMRKDTLL